jgi:hypothetical protein
VVSFTPLSLYPRGKSPRGIHWVRGWVGPRAGLDASEKTKFLTLPGIEFRSLGLPARSFYTDCGIFWTCRKCGKSKGLQSRQVLIKLFPFTPSSSKCPAQRPRLYTSLHLKGRRCETLKPHTRNPYSFTVHFRRNCTLVFRLTTCL